MALNESRLRLLAGASRWLWATLVVIALDQWTKWLIQQDFELFEIRVVLPVFNLVRLHNEGAAFSFLSDASGWQRWFFTVLALAVSTAILIWLRRLPARGQNLLAAGLACIMGGALGNAIDRLLLGYVVDFIQVHYQTYTFPAFNIADSAITIGAALVILDNILQPGKTSVPR